MFIYLERLIGIITCSIIRNKEKAIVYMGAYGYALHNFSKDN